MMNWPTIPLLPTKNSDSMPCYPKWALTAMPYFKSVVKQWESAEPPETAPVPFDVPLTSPEPIFAARVAPPEPERPLPASRRAIFFDVSVGNMNGLLGEGGAEDGRGGRGT